MNESRSRHYYQGRIPRQKRKLPIFGSVSYINGSPVKDQSNKLFRCWNCGFPCNSDDNATGDGAGYRIVDRVDSIYLDTNSSSIEYPQSNGIFAIMIEDELITTPLLSKIDSEGNPVEPIHSLSKEVFSGCPMCGTRNWK
jgi:hypothetical protein